MYNLLTMSNKKEKTNSQILNPSQIDVQADENILEIDSRISSFLISTSNNFWLLAKTHFKGSSFILINLLMPILISTSVLAFMPPKAAFMWIAFMTMTFSGLATYGVIVFVISKSTFVKNINLSSTKTSSIYASVFLLVGISIFISFTIGVICSMILDNIGFTMSAMMSSTNGINKFSSEEMMWGKLFTTGGMWYYLFEQVALCFAISFFVEKVFITQKTFFLFVFGYLLAGIILSGIFSSTLYVTSDGVVDVIDPNNIDQEAIGNNMVLEPLCWGGALWKMGQIIPHFGANQLAVNISRKISYREVNIIPGITLNLKNNWSDASILQSVLINKKITYYALMPWIWTSGLIFIAKHLDRN